MALQLLAGPFPMMDNNGNYALIFQKPCWFDSLMSIACVTEINSAFQTGTLVELDGHTSTRNPALTVYDIYCPDFAGTGIAVVSAYGSGSAIRNVNAVTLYPEGTPEPDPIHFVSGACFLPDRVLFSALYSRPYGTTGAGTLEATLPTMNYGGIGVTFSPGPGAGQVFISAVDAAVLYDYVNRQVIGWQRKLGFDAAFPPMYSPALGVWIVVTYSATPSPHHAISVYSDEPVPTNLSAPVALAAVGRGSAVQYQTRLLGANSEPCAGVLVDWSCTTPGVVQIAQSTTDANGYATTRVSLPLGSSGATFNVTAGVTL